MGREYFCAYYSYLEWMESLSDAEKGRLFVACLEYSKSGKEPELRGNEKVVFPAVRRQIDRDREVYEKKCERLRQNGSKGGKANSKQMVANGKQLLANAKQMVANGGHLGGNCYQIEKKEKNQKKEKRTNTITPLCGFDSFWKEYPKKVSKQEAVKAFNKLEPNTTLLDTILEALRAQKRSSDWTRDNGQYIPHPATWLNQRRWEDEGTQIEPQEEDRYANLRRLYTMFAEEEASQ